MSTQERKMVKRIIHANLLEQHYGAYQYPIHDPLNQAAFYTGLTPEVLLEIKANMHTFEDKHKIIETNKRQADNSQFIKLSQRMIIMDAIDKVFTNEFLIRNPTCAELFRAVEYDWPEYDKYITKYSQVARFIKKRYESMDQCMSSRTRKELFEIKDVALKRYTYLREIREYRQQNRNIIYLDEMWVNDKLKCTKSWENLYDLSKIDELKHDVILITLSAASKYGFLPEALNIKSATTTESDTVHLKHFKSWLSSELLRCLPKSSVIVIDNELYHECYLWRHPTEISNKAAICDWLQKNDAQFHFSTDMPAEMLLNLAQKQAQLNTIQGTKDVLEKAGHKLLNIPSFMSKLNPFMLMWDKLKTDLGNLESEPMKNSDVKHLIADKISQITPQDWKSFDEQVCKREEYLWTKDKRLLDNIKELEQLYMKEKSNEQVTM